MSLELEARARSLGRPLLMGIVNLTPDSFFAPSRASAQAAVDAALRLEAEGADLLDLGGESTRPGAEPVSVEDELARVLPVLEAVAARAKVPLSIDTRNAETARRALSAGARVLNDVSALRHDAAMGAVAAEYPLVVLMHMRGDDPRRMQDEPRYGDVAAEVSAFLRERLEALGRAGGDPARAWIDPGIGFGKTAEHNLELFRRLEELRSLGHPLLVGASRKSFLGGAPE
ncbi:MAG TPA: dihydropteroate synthase, partial [Elusimicrobiota bacterium]|nr:dihydropteroate synthase [Elusimicrobiota bacterium]